MLNNILLQAQGTGWANILMIVVLIAIFYLFMIRPQQKKQNEIKKFREGIKAGDRVVTEGVGTSVRAGMTVRPKTAAAAQATAE